MRLFNALRNLDQKFSWSFLGFVIAIVLGAVSIYTAFFYAPRPSVTFEVVTNARVLDLRADVGDIDIRYRGRDLSEGREQLGVLMVRVANTGRMDIPKNYYDEDDPFGFAIVGATVLQGPEVVSASSEYLRSNAKVTLDGTSLVRIAPIILDAHQSFDVKVLVTFAPGQVVHIAPRGKIAGVRRIIVTTPYLDSTIPSIWSVTFRGGPGVQAIRIVAYSILGILVFGLLIMTAVWVSDVVRRASRKIRCRRYARRTGLPIASELRLFLKMYVKQGIVPLLIAQDLATREKERMQIYVALDAGTIDADHMTVWYHADGEKLDEIVDGHEMLRLLVQIRNTGLIVRTSEGFSADAELRHKLEAFLAFLREEGKLGAKSHISWHLYGSNPRIHDHL